jgi:hypothetical protein
MIYSTSLFLLEIPCKQCEMMEYNKFFLPDMMIWGKYFLSFLTYSVLYNIQYNTNTRRTYTWHEYALINTLDWQCATGVHEAVALYKSLPWMLLGHLPWVCLALSPSSSTFWLNFYKYKLLSHITISYKYRYSWLAHMTDPKIETRCTLDFLVQFSWIVLRFRVPRLGHLRFIHLRFQSFGA